MNKKDWIDKVNDAFLNLDRTDVDFFKELTDIYSDNSTELQNAIFIFFSKYFDKEDVDLLKLKQKLTRKELKEYKGNLSNPTKLNVLHEAIEKQADKLNDDLQQAFYVYLVYTIKYAYGKNISDSLLKEIIETKWEGYNYSGAIDGNTKHLIENLKTTLKKEFIKGSSPRQVAREIRKRYDVTKSRAEMLILTYGAFVVNEVMKNRYGEAGYRYYRNRVTVDNRTSDICMDIHRENKKYRFHEYEPGVTAPPFHYHCRTIIVPA